MRIELEFDRGGIDQLEKFARAVIQIDRQDDERFRLAISQAVSLLGLSHQAIADEFDISWATVTLWINGQISPHPAVRPVIYRWLAEQAESGVPSKPRELHPQPEQGHKFTPGQ